MARPEKIRLEVPAAIGTGRAEHVFRLIRKTVQVFGTFAATLQLEGSIDGGAFAPKRPSATRHDRRTPIERRLRVKGLERHTKDDLEHLGAGIVYRDRVQASP